MWRALVTALPLALMASVRGPGRLQCIHVAERVGRTLMHRGAVEFGLAGRGVLPVLAEISV